MAVNFDHELSFILRRVLEHAVKSCDVSRRFYFLS
jgi:hypothetical protein